MAALASAGRCRDVPNARPPPVNAAVSVEFVVVVASGESVVVADDCGCDGEKRLGAKFLLERKKNSQLKH